MLSCFIPVKTNGALKFQIQGMAFPNLNCLISSIPSVRWRAAATRVHGGFGLGLSIVKQLVNLMNGEIKVQSKMDEGTTFIITLPLVVRRSNT